MKSIFAAVLGFLLLGFWPTAHAAPSAIAVDEISYLLTYIDHSGCQFYRNGDWYDSHRAQLHLRNKYDYLVARDRIQSADDFIEQAASTSSMSGKEYQIQCEGGPAITSNSWLRSALIAYRATAAQGATNKTSPTK